eukprot:SAG31_NODE_2338_length_5921_cov_1.887324_4_plen_79_part_00
MRLWRKELLLPPKVRRLMPVAKGMSMPHLLWIPSRNSRRIWKGDDVRAVYAVCWYFKRAIEISSAGLPKFRKPGGEDP